MIVAPFWERNRPLQNRWDGVVLPVKRKLHGYHSSASEQDHFNKVLRDAKLLCTGTKNSAEIAPDSIRLAGRMLDFDELRQIIMDIETFDDIDKDIAERMLKFLEPKIIDPSGRIY